MESKIVLDMKGSFSRITITKLGGLYQIKICDPDTGKQFSSFEGTWNEVTTLKNALCELWDREENNP